jgi:tRNA(fMet)-specific endonuclease VapC
VAGVLIDTSVLIDVERGDSTLDELPTDVEHSISVITVSELLHGVHRAVSERIRTRRQVIVEGLLDAFEPLPITTHTARVHAGIWAHLEAAGEIVATHDLWIAATALTHDLMVATSNPGDFRRVPGLEVLAVGRAT